MAEVQDALHRALLHMFYHPLQVFRLQVGDAHMAHHSLSAQLHQGGQRLLGHLLQSAGQRSLELDVVDIDQVDVVHVQALHTLIDTLRSALGGVVPRVDAVLPVAAHLRREIVFVTGNLLEGFP